MRGDVHSLPSPGASAQRAEASHSFGDDWKDNGGGPHPRSCVCGKTQTEGHVGGTDTCTEGARCSLCGAEYGNPLGHDLVHHDAQAPTCTEIGWDAYDTCSRCDYTTYVEKKALDHDLVHHDAQAPTCTEIVWDAYDTCSRCDYTTYIEKRALDHDMIHHDAQAPNCTEIGWDAYDTCSRCDYTTYKEIAALGHTEVVDEAIAPTCTETGLTEGSHCSVCGEILTVQASIPALGHRYGLWEHAESGKHQARCTRCGAVAKVDCAHIALPQTDPDAEPITLCPICGHRDNADDLVRVTDAKAKGAYGNLVVFITGEDEPNRFLTVAFEWNGRLVQPRNTVTVTLPAELLDSCDLFLIASDGTETQLVPEITGDLTTFTLDFVVENERLLARLLRMQQKA